MKLNYKKLSSDVQNLSYAHEGDAAFDLRSIEDDFILKPMEKHTVKTGIAMEIPVGFVGNIRDRSGLAAKNGIHTLAGIIDSGYRGEIGVVLINLGHKPFKVEKGMRIAQMLIMPVNHVELTEVEDVSETKRGQGGFGSTGLK